MRDNSLLPHRSRALQRKLDQDRKAFQSAMIDTTSIGAWGHRKMNRLAWEGERSPSRLGRAGERVSQMAAVLGPTATTVVAVISAVKTTIEFVDWLKHRNDEPKEQAAPKPEPEPAKS